MILSLVLLGAEVQADSPKIKASSWRCIDYDISLRYVRVFVHCAVVFHQWSLCKSNFVHLNFTFIGIPQEFHLLVANSGQQVHMSIPCCYPVICFLHVFGGTQNKLVNLASQGITKNLISRISKTLQSERLTLWFHICPKGDVDLEQGI